ncbi:hypothetical protein niasHT_025165 [Heterodera trifolii]|uniref:Uncharacterized protein n=1 Tax=Heterodera trifolii TaxID=157864 RepID=A0ABD2JLT9_9BILA
MLFLPSSHHHRSLTTSAGFPVPFPAVCLSPCPSSWDDNLPSPSTWDDKLAVFPAPGGSPPMCLWPNTNIPFALTLPPPSFIIQFTSFSWPMLILLQPLVVCPSPISRIFSSLYVPMPSALCPSKVSFPSSSAL